VSEPDPTLLEWVAAAKQGDQDAFAEIVYSFQDAVFNLCYRMLSNHAEAEDATQEAFLRAYLNLKRYDTNRSFKTWILSIASNHCIDRLRKRRVTFTSIDEPTTATLSLSTDDPGPEEVAVRHERSARIQGYLDQLGEDDRVAVVLRYWYDYSYVEIAETLDTTESAIKSRLFRARRALADLMSSPMSSESGLAGSGLSHPSLLEEN
jgi:RNA polymerase sigma-70 factor (ECF subfamily)